MRLIFLGPPGSGKGTHSKILSKKLGIRHISTGDLIREEEENETELGKQFKKYTEKGKLVPDELVIALLKKHLPKENFILDGFPRTLEQAKALESITRIDKVIVLEVDEKEIIARLTSRLQCPKCGRIYGKDLRPKEDEICDVCKVKLIRRTDDKPEVIKERLELYKKETLPVIRYYEKKGIVKRVNANGSVEEVAKRVYNAVTS